MIFPDEKMIKDNFKNSYMRESWEIESEYYKRTGEIPARHLLIEFDEVPYIAGWKDCISHIKAQASDGFYGYVEELDNEGTRLDDS